MSLAGDAFAEASACFVSNPFMLATKLQLFQRQILIPHSVEQICLPALCECERRSHTVRPIAQAELLNVSDVTGQVAVEPLVQLADLSNFLTKAGNILVGNLADLAIESIRNCSLNSCCSLLSAP